MKTASIVFFAGAPLELAGKVPLNMVTGTVRARETLVIAIRRSSKRELRFNISPLEPYCATTVISTMVVLNEMPIFVDTDILRQVEPIFPIFPPDSTYIVKI